MQQRTSGNETLLSVHIYYTTFACSVGEGVCVCVCVCVCAICYEKSLWKRFISKETDERKLNRRTNSVFILISLPFCVGV